MPTACECVYICVCVNVCLETLAEFATKMFTWFHFKKYKQISGGKIRAYRIQIAHVFPRTQSKSKLLSYRQNRLSYCGGAALETFWICSSSNLICSRSDFSISSFEGSLGATMRLSTLGSSCSTLIGESSIKCI